MQHDEAGERIRILVLTTTLPTEEGDATPSFVLDLAQEMAEQGGLQTVIVAPAAGSAAKREKFGSVEVRRFRYLPGSLESLGATTAIMPAVRARPLLLLQLPFLLSALAVVSLREARRLKPDIIHAHWIVPTGAWAVALRWLARLRRAAILITCHGADVFALRGAVWNRVRRWVVGHADLVLPVSKEMAAQLGTPPEEAIPMGAARLFSQYRWAPTAGAPLLFVGRLDRKKGVGDLLHAMALTEQLELRIVGDGPLRSELEQQAQQLGVAGQVTFVGALPKAGVAQELAAAAALVLPSVIAEDGDQEGTPTVIAEALTVGVPVVATRVGGISDVLAGTARTFLVNPGEPEVLAEALRATVGLQPEGTSRRPGAHSAEAAARAYLGRVSDLLGRREARRHGTGVLS